MKTTLLLIIFGLLLALQTSKSQTSESVSSSLEYQLVQEQIEKIKRGEAIEPIALTPEMDEQLVREGILPPVEDNESNNDHESYDENSFIYFCLGFFAGITIGYGFAKRPRQPVSN